MSGGLFFQSISFVAKEIVGDILYFPIWWYSVGLKKRLDGFVDTARQANQEFALSIWVKNLFVPMYGQSDWQGRLVSFFMRLVQIIGRGILAGLWLIIGLVVIVVWIFAPVFIIWQIVMNL